jgi:phosphopantothenoylcysteine decarboxylase
VLHIELRKWADAMLIAPLSANTLAKVTYNFFKLLFMLGL